MSGATSACCWGIFVVLILILVMMAWKEGLFDELQIPSIGEFSGLESGELIKPEDIIEDPLDDIKQGFLSTPEPHRSTDYSQAEFEVDPARMGKSVWMSYSDQIAKGAVDPDIIESHNEYLKDTYDLATLGASHAATRDDFNPAVQFYGLPRNAHYAQTASMPDSRQSQSEDAQTVKDIKEHNSSGYEGGL